MLFKRTRTELANKKEAVPVNLWCRGAGDLIVDLKLEPGLEKSKPDLSFDERGEFALRRMYSMRKERAQLDKELKDLKETNRALTDGQNNVRTSQLKKELKRLAEQYTAVSAERLHYKQLSTQTEGSCRLMESRLALVGELKGLDTMSSGQLLALERFLFTSLDTVKVKIQ
jgi:hypothetical protein